MGLLIPHSQAHVEERLGKISPIVGTLHISGMAETSDFVCISRVEDPNLKSAKVTHRRSGQWSRDPDLNLGTLVCVERLNLDT